MCDAQTFHNSDLLVIAAKRGRVSEVQRLIPISDPLLDESRALIAAASHGHVECVKLLIPVSYPHQVLWGLKNNPSPDPDSYEFFEAFMAQRERNILSCAGGVGGVQKPKKM